MNTIGSQLSSRFQDRKLLFAGVLFGILASIFYIVYPSSFKGHQADVHLKESHQLRGPPDTDGPLPPSPSLLHVYLDAAVCSDSDVCSGIGRDILQQGGTAVDAAIAMLACNSLITMQSMGLGGGFIMNTFVKSKNNSCTVIAREMAPLALNEADLQNQGPSHHLKGSLSIGVPGELKGYSIAHKLFGSLSWKDIFSPTIVLCEKGYLLSKHQWDSLHINPRVLENPLLRKTFVNDTTKEFHSVGSLIRPPKVLCRTYKTLAENGPEVFYTGDLAKLVLEDLSEYGSVITLEDLTNYQAEIVDTIKLSLGTDIINLVPPVGSGAIVGLVLNILKGFNLSKNDDILLLTHRIVEALKFGFAKRWELGDPKFINVDELLQNITSTSWTTFLREKINDAFTQTNPEYYGAHAAPSEDHGTGHISVLAPNGDAVSVTSTIHYYFGSAFMGRRTGILFNNAINDFSIPGLHDYFSLPLAEANRLQPKKRPMSSMAPTIVTDTKGSVKTIVGAAGGPKIISALVNVLVRMLWLGQDIKEAIDAPRFHHQLLPNVIEYEYGMLRSVIHGLEETGHNTERYRERGSVVCGIMKNATGVFANVDYRKLGGVAGF